MTPRYFAWHWDVGYEFFETEDAARKWAEDALEGDRECADTDGWAEELTPKNCPSGCGYGRITHHAQAHDCQAKTDDPEDWDSEWDETYGVRIVEIEEAPE